MDDRHFVYKNAENKVKPTVYWCSMINFNFRSDFIK